MSQTSQTRIYQKKVDIKENTRVIFMCTFSVTQEMTNSGLDGAQTDLHISNKSQTNLQKQVHTFANKSICFYVHLKFLMCTIPCFILKYV